MDQSRPSGGQGPASQIGAYRLIRQIGEGGMGAVWLAEHAMLGRRAAIKVLHPSYSARQDIVTRFFNEARAATAISDPGIVQIFDFGYHTDGSAYIVMELLDGETLHARQQRLGKLPVGDALRILRQVSSSLGEAHARGIVHRDLKPENIFLVRDPEVPGGERAKILDFGIAKLSDDQAGIKTQSFAMMGTPHFMSPEQCRGAGQVDQRSDIYALGCVMMVIVTGRPPFDAAGAGELIVLHLREPAPRVSSRVADVPPAVDDLIARCLEKDPASRFASGAELASALGALLRQRLPTPLPFEAPVAGAPIASGTASPTPAPSPQGNATPVPNSIPAAASGWAAATPAPAQSPMAAPVVAGVSTTLSGSATAHAVTPPRRRRWIGPVAIGGVAVAGLLIWVAAHGSSETTKVAAGSATNPVDAAASDAAAAAAINVPVAAPDDRLELAKAHIKKVLTAFTQWSPSHAGAPCPSASDLATVLGDVHQLDDPWGHAVGITCADQPETQIIGVVSAGRDGALATADDVQSWTLGADVTSLVQGARWRRVVTVKVPTTSTSTDHHSSTHTSSTSDGAKAGSAATTVKSGSTAVKTPATGSGSGSATTSTTTSGGIPRTR